MPNLIDLAGQKFGRLFVIERAPNNKDGRAMWKCVCDCGNKRIVMGKSLRNGHTQSCGCLNKEATSNKSFINRVGKRFGRLVVVSRVEDYIAPSGKKHIRYKCLCDCGKETVVDVCQLVQGHTKSCGCLHNEIMQTGNVKHGGRYDRLYKVYTNMKNRCYNRNSNDYQYYGARSIKICDEWFDNYSAFRDWAYNNGYNNNAAHGTCTIDRIDVNGNYEPQNCRWVSMSVQSKNRRNVINKNKR